MSTTWTIPRESKEWVGPIIVTVDDHGTPIPVDPAAIKFAVVPLEQRPGLDQWLDPVVEPGGTAIGIQADPISETQRFSIWVKFTDNTEIPVLIAGTLIRS